jgi:thiol-disulfide isomerase/thioredoxin
MHINDSSWKTNSGKKLIFFLSAGFCPYCAAERWAIVEGLRKFGEWKELIENNHKANTNEKFLNIPTFDFSHFKYESSFVEFRGNKISDRYISKEKEILEKIDA